MNLLKPHRDHASKPAESTAQASMMSAHAACLVTRKSIQTHGQLKSSKTHTCGTVAVSQYLPELGRGDLVGLNKYFLCLFADKTIQTHITEHDFEEGDIEMLC